MGLYESGLCGSPFLGRRKISAASQAVGKAESYVVVVARYIHSIGGCGICLKR